MTHIRRRAWQFLIAVVVGFGALIAFRSLIVAAVSAALAGLSAQAVAAMVGKAATTTAVPPVHLTAAVGAFVGSLFLLLNLRGRAWPEKSMLLAVSAGGSYFGGVATSEIWALGPGGTGFAGMLCGVLLIPIADAAMAVLKDIAWIKRLLFVRLGGQRDAGDSEQ
ncbi:hypothetical protein [Microvirgula aerodenitrificans]|uniref:hypothetical protein n=1 Tax=Microvirgula aerodenitrificans TaxID=57480 RepID=UPI00048B8868|nr:hypothetical protein [Microvirgula aerodenitrificans]